MKENTSYDRLDLIAQLERLWQKITPLIRTKIKSGNYSLNKEEKSQLQNYLDTQKEIRSKGELNGVNFIHAQFEPIIARVHLGQELEIEAFKPNQSINIETDYDNQCRLAAMSAVYAFFKGSRIIIIPTTNKESNPKEFQRQIKVFATDFTKQGKEANEYLVLDDRSLSERTAYLLVPKLLLLDKNSIQKSSDGSLYWLPNAFENPLVCIEQSNKGKVIGLRPGIKLCNADGKWTNVAQQAASFFNKSNKNKAHIIIGPEDEISYQDQVWELVRALGLQPDQYQNIFYKRGTALDIIKAIISKVLARTKAKVESEEKRVKHLKSKGGNFDSWDKFNVVEYTWRNYGKGIMPEDKQIIEIVITQLKKLLPSKTSFKSIADIGAGPNLYSSMLITPYLTKTSILELRDYSPNNRDYLNWALGKGAEKAASKFEKLKGIWSKFENLMRGIDAQYKGGLERVRRLAKPKFSDIRELRDSELDAATSFFVTESITDDVLEFVFATEKVVRSVKRGGVFILAHMIESEGYYAGEGNFPAVKLSFDEIKDFYRELLGENNFVISNVIEEKEKVRTGYRGMAVIVGAVPKQEQIASFDHMATWAMNLQKQKVDN